MISLTFAGILSIILILLVIRLYYLQKTDGFGFTKMEQVVIIYVGRLVLLGIIISLIIFAFWRYIK